MPRKDNPKDRLGQMDLAPARESGRNTQGQSKRPPRFDETDVDDEVPAEPGAQSDARK